MSRECVYYINLRQAYLLSPYYANRLSSRTVLFTCVPQQNLDEAKLRKIFGDAVKNVWIPREFDELNDLVEERNQTALRLEVAEIALIKIANEERNRALKHGHPDLEANIGIKDMDKNGDMDVTVKPISFEDPRSEISPASPASPGLKWGDNGYGIHGPPPDINGSVAAQWIPHSSRPSHRPIANFGRRVDTIKWTRNQIKALTPKINKLRRQHHQGKVKPIPAAFIEFDTQISAQSAYQTLSHHRAFHMTPHINGIRPHEIIWSSLRMKWWERIIRGFAISAFIAAMVVFWSIPAALIGLISNINFLTDKLPFLSFINRLPHVILGLITGLMPVIGISLLMASVPIILRCMYTFHLS